MAPARGVHRASTVASTGRGVVRVMKTLLTSRTVAILAAAQMLFWLPQTPAAQAHPFGEPQTAAISATANGLQLVWSAEPDDLTVLAAWIGATDGAGSLLVIEDGVLVTEESTELPGTRLAGAPQFPAYLMDRIEVLVEGTPCTGALLPVDDVETEGATLDFDCGGPVPSADVRIATLTDIDEAYRIFATGPRGQRRTYSASAEVSRWTLRDGDGRTTTPAADPSATDSPGRSALKQLGGIGAALVAAAAALGLVARRRRRHPQVATIPRRLSSERSER